MPSPSDHRELLCLETELFTLAIKGPAEHPSFPGSPMGGSRDDSRVTAECAGCMELHLAGEEGPGVPQAVLDGGRHVLVLPASPLFFEQQNYELLIEPAPDCTARLAFRHENPQLRDRVAAIGRRSRILSGIINFGSDIGFSDLEVLADGRPFLKLTLEVFPTKISYRDDYQAILRDVTEEVWNLAFDFLKRTYGTFGPTADARQSPVEFLAILRHVFREFTAAADQVLASPHHALAAEHSVVPARKARRTDGQSLRWLEKHPGCARRTEDGLAVEKVLAVRRHATCDTRENRLAKYMLADTLARLARFRSLYAAMARGADEAVLDEIDAMAAGIRRRMETGFMAEIEASAGGAGMSLVFTSAPGYRRLYRCRILLQHGLSVTGSIFRTSVKDLATLYEYWCFIKLGSILRARCRMKRQNVLRTSAGGIFVTLARGVESSMEFTSAAGDVITLSYNQSASRVPTVSQRPDNVLSLKKDGRRTYTYVFDAKYRIDPALPGSPYAAAYRRPGPKEDDINTMHRYRDAIVGRGGTAAGEWRHRMFGAYVLFPYANEEEYREHRFFKSIAEVNIGGLPFLPSATGMVEAMLDDLAAESHWESFRRAVLPSGIEERLRNTDWGDRSVLLGVCRGFPQYEACVRGRFYYMPLDKARKSIPDLDTAPPRHVALYRPSGAPSGRAGIELHGDVLRASIVPRREIPVPMAPGADGSRLCCRLDLGPLHRLDRAIIPAGERSMMFRRTTPFLLENAQTVPELLLATEEEFRFYCELRRMSSDRAILDDEASPEERRFRIAGCVVVFLGGRIRLMKGADVLWQLPASEFLRSPGPNFRACMAAARGAVA